MPTVPVTPFDEIRPAGLIAERLIDCALIWKPASAGLLATGSETVAEPPAARACSDATVEARLMSQPGALMPMAANGTAGPAAPRKVIAIGETGSMKFVVRSQVEPRTGRPPTSSSEAESDGAVSRMLAPPISDDRSKSPGSRFWPACE